MFATGRIERVVQAIVEAIKFQRLQAELFTEFDVEGRGGAGILAVVGSAPAVASSEGD